MSPNANGVDLETPGTLDARTQIREQILDFLDIPGSANPKQLPRHTLNFEAPWFGESLQIGDAELLTLTQVIVLTGIDCQAWATSCLEYIESVWPDVGVPVLETLSRHFRLGSKNVYTC